MIHPDQRVGLAVMDVQTLHIGHVRLLTHLLSTTPVRIVGLGSTKKFGTEGHPFTFEQRQAMIETIYGKDTFRFVPLDDIDASIDNDAWCNYVLRKIAGIGLPAPTDYFSGSRIDAKWYEYRFASLATTSYETRFSEVYEDLASGRRIHIVDRHKTGFISGREIRFLIEKRDAEWKRHVPELLHGFVEWNYPPQLRQAVRADSMPDPALWPVGTRFLAKGAKSLADTFELKDDGRWRRLGGARDEKAEHARNRRGPSARTDD
jgi:hypothetical protein